MPRGHAKGAALLEVHDGAVKRGNRDIWLDLPDGRRHIDKVLRRIIGVAVLEVQFCGFEVGLAGFFGCVKGESGKEREVGKSLDTEWAYINLLPSQRP